MKRGRRLHREPRPAAGGGQAGARQQGARPPGGRCQGSPTAKEIAAYRRDSATYFGLLCLCSVISRIDTAPPIVALAPQRAVCAIREGYGDRHPVRTRHENAMPRLFDHAQVDGMPAHSNDAEGAMRNVARRYMDAHAQFKGPRGMDVGSRKMTIAASGGRRGTSVGRAATCALADPGWNMVDGPAEAGEPPAWLPPGGGGARSGGAG